MVTVTRQHVSLLAVTCLGYAAPIACLVSNGLVKASNTWSLFPWLVTWAAIFVVGSAVQLLFAVYAPLVTWRVGAALFCAPVGLAVCIVTFLLDTAPPRPICYIGPAAIIISFRTIVECGLRDEERESPQDEGVFTLVSGVWICLTNLVALWMAAKHENAYMAAQIGIGVGGAVGVGAIGGCVLRGTVQDALTQTGEVLGFCVLGVAFALVPWVFIFLACLWVVAILNVFGFVLVIVFLVVLFAALLWLGVAVREKDEDAHEAQEHARRAGSRSGGSC